MLETPKALGTYQGDNSKDEKWAISRDSRGNSKALRDYQRATF